jgi:hypothetical protein
MCESPGTLGAAARKTSPLAIVGIRGKEKQRA